MNNPSINTVKIGPIEHKATRPKLSFLDFCLAVKPIPIAKINGTDIGPVVTPPESNDRGIISLPDINNIIKSSE